MKKLIIISIIIICNSLSIFALPDHPVKENSTKQTKPVEKNNYLYVELFGNGGIISLNYERYFSDNLSFRVGWGTTIIAPILIPITVNYSYKNIFEFGIGIVPYANAPTGSWGGEYFAYKENGLFVTSVIGFKKIYKGFIYKLSLTPFYNTGGSNWVLSVGLSFGVAF